MKRTSLNKQASPAVLSFRFSQFPERIELLFSMSEFSRPQNDEMKLHREQFPKNDYM